MRRRLASICSLLLPSACAEYEGESFDRVVRAADVGHCAYLPVGYEIIGGVTARSENTIDGGPIEYALWCEVDARLERRLRRVAARNGGELLVSVDCEHHEHEDASTAYDDDGTAYVETSLTCETKCWADVARRIPE